jgi:hypothetical protein
VLTAETGYAGGFVGFQVLTAIRLLRPAANWGYWPVGVEAWARRRLCNAQIGASGTRWSASLVRLMYGAPRPRTRLARATAEGEIRLSGTGSFPTGGGACGLGKSHQWRWSSY